MRIRSIRGIENAVAACVECKKINGYKPCRINPNWTRKQCLENLRTTEFPDFTDE